MAGDIKKIVFVTGGARSGKSFFTMSEALKIKGRKAYIATAEALDAEMKERIEKHKKDRGDEWDTYEEPLDISDAINKIKDKYSVILVDCLTLWLSNLLINDKVVEKEISRFLDSLSSTSCTLYIVSNEVGMGIVPENELARRFRDLAGMLNQKAAEIADDVYMVVAGIPLKIKSSIK
ncbi:MAG: bifunctional adenosylcobinamide kinase/adenosylcobinamide-phosphate guanylyltransferase [Nitrospirae bacterium]|nr:bifunctional adenosylcobinamide kinase/adenosylcobinamide-phosphate guanylyltransferase [Nitrospirota bacterium]